MPAKNATRQARKAQSPSAQAGEYVREEVEHVRVGKHGARSAKQVIAIGLSKARRRWTVTLPETKTARPARKAKSPSTQAGEYVREEVEHVREGKHGARSAKQVIAIGL